MAKVSSRNLPGASYNTRAAKWQARMEIDGQRKHLGYFDTAEEASKAYADAKGTVAKVRTEKAVRERPERARASSVNAAALDPWEVDPVTLAALLPADMWTGPRGEPDPIGVAKLFAHGALASVAQVSRLENVSVYTACEVQACGVWTYEDAGEVDKMRAMVRQLKALGLIDRASEVADLVMAAGAPMTFNDAVARLVGAGDLV
jgi:hypothetical protein